jgi:hypothetical protein
MKTPYSITRMALSILEKDIDARDDYYIVVKEIHDFELALHDLKRVDYYEALFSRKLSDPQTIARAWRKIQEEIPELRGELWEERQVHAGEIAAEIAKSKYKQLPLF